MFTAGSPNNHPIEKVNHLRKKNSFFGFQPLIFNGVVFRKESLGVFDWICGIINYHYFSLRDLKINLHGIHWQKVFGQHPNEGILSNQFQLSGM